MDETRQEFVPKEEASVLPKYLDNVDAELEGHLVAIPVVQDTEFKAETVKKKEILDFGDEGKRIHSMHKHTHTETNTQVHTRTRILTAPSAHSCFRPQT